MEIKIQKSHIQKGSKHMITELFRGISINHDICLYLTGGKNSIDTFGHIHDRIDITLYI